MAEPGATLDNAPTTGGKLMQWHIHDTPMIHVWVTSHPCGPFSALEGIGAGTIPEGDTRLCDHLHGA